MLVDLINSADRLCDNLDLIHKNEKEFNKKLYVELENFSRQMFLMLNEIKQIKEYCINEE